MQPSLAKMLKLFLVPSKFLEDELGHIEEMRSEGKAYQPAEDFREEAGSRIRAKRANLAKSFLLMSCLVAAGGVLAMLANTYYSLSMTVVALLRAVSVVLIGWAVFGRLGDIETFKGETLLEITSDYVYRRTYSLGILLGSFALFLVSGNDA